MKPPRFNYARPETLAEAIRLLASHDGDAKPIAGGQSLMPMLAFRLAAPALLVDIGRLPDLNRIEVDTDGIRLGALVRWRDIERDQRLAHAHPLLAAAIAHVAHYQIRNRGTVGGSLAHADPAAEMPGIAMTCDAQIRVVGNDGERVIAAEDFFRAALVTDLAADELIVEIFLPPWRANRRWAFEEFTRRRGDFAIAGVALFYDLDGEGRARDPHVGVIGIGDRPIRLSAVELLLEGKRIDAAVVAQAAQTARDEVEPSDDIHASADYRRALVGVLIERALCRAAQIKVPEAA